MAWGVGPVGDIAQLRNEIRQLKSELEAIADSMERHTPLIRNQLLLLDQTLILTRRLTGDENLNHAISTFLRIKAIAQGLITTFYALQAAAGPIGWLSAGIGFATIGVSVATLEGY